MDLYNQNHQPPSHYESVVLTQDTHALTELVKHQAFDFMDQLEGWCSKSKAGILVDLIFIMRPQTIVEIGVWGGKSLIPMACALKYTEKGKIYGIDPWDNMASAEGMDGVNYEWWSSVNHTGILRGLEQKIAKFGLSHHIKLIKSSSENAEIIPNIDILHIDGNHSEQASTLDVNKWLPLVRKGGIIILDDISWFDTTSQETTRNAVKLMDASCIRLADYHEDSDWGIWIKP